MKKLLLFLILLSSMHKLYAQELAVSGTVKDNKGQPIPGIVVTESERNTSTQTNGEGYFSIKTSKASTLVFRGIGYTSQSVKATSSVINISLVESTTDLSDVMVVGYSTKKRSELSSAVSVVSGEKLNDVTSVSLGTLLQGKVPGVVASSASGDPTSGSSIVIRGAGTINASTGPLYVVDGNIGGSYNPSDVESVTVLRDAAATGLYGSRAANGVVIITTKKGKSGETRFSLSSVVGFAKATTGNFKLMDAQQLYDYQSTFFTPAPASLNNNTNWWDLAFRNAMVNNHTLTASGGTEKSQFYIAGNYYKEEGTLIDNDKTQYSLRANLTSQLTKRLKLTALLNGLYVNDNYNSAGTVYQAYLNLPYDPAYNTDGTPVDARYGTWYGRDRSNFLHSLQYNYSKARSYRTTADLNLDYNILDNLTLSTYNRANIYNYRSSSYYDKRTKEGATNNGSAYLGNSFSSTLLSSNRLKYNVTFGQHNLSVLAVGEIEKGYSDSNSASAKGLPAGRDAFSTATDIINNPTGGYDNYQFIKYLAQADYSLADKYFAVASVVNEYSSRFGSNNPDATFYQLGASWIITKEKFMESVKPISFLKLRASYGTTGNADGIGYYASMGLYNINSNASYAGLPGAAPSQMANPDLTWEKSKSVNLGLDIQLFKRIDISIDAYQKTNSSLLFFRELPATTGYSGVYENVGVIRNRGLELNITSKNFVKKDFTWETNFNIALNRNKVLEVNQGRSEVYAGASQPIGVGHNMDEWFMPVWAGVDPANGKPLWQNSIADADGNSYVLYTNTYNLASRVYTGKSSAPKFTGGLSNTFSYKAFTLSTFFNFVYGNYVYNTSRFYFDNDGLYESYNQMQLANGWSRWEKPGDIATHPKPVFGRSDASNQTSTRYLENGSYLRLRNVTLGYNVPANFAKKLYLQNARIFVSGDNLWTLTRFSGTDPEVDLASGDSSIKYPTSRKFMFGINISF
ncbi:SusC/RagA family TonB-linked outer membrane protein [Pedobacter rhodius]|uniref:TonB-dependent receptor n=1 Tax=Pedobacter rhodius TaxID=3004098 RepID=A0ABT4KU49_9SPHI|nr:TonB-dependent receptor [Pedobacter sp. SJ11]MCZ4222446.1 TonB-dependent receptor [Pedobacter sp. SJ11]